MKNESTRKVINVDKPNYVPLFEFKELDNAVIRLSLFKASVEFDITGQTVKLGAKTSKGLKEQSEGFTINKNNLDIDLKNSILVPGTVEIDLELKDASGTMTTASFFITVKSKVLNDKAVEGTNEFDTFTKTAAKIEEDYKGLRRIIIDENQAANLQDQVNQTNAQLDKMMYTRFRKKKIVFIGDSIVLGFVDKPYATLVGEVMGMEVVNMGVSGSAITVTDDRSDSVYERRGNIPEDADIICIAAGTNDKGHNSSMGNFDQVNSDGSFYNFYGAFYNLIKWTLENRPNAKIFVMTPSHREDEYIENTQGYVLEDYVNVELDICNHFSIPVLDLYAITCFNPNIAKHKELFAPDGLHPLQTIHTLLGTYIIPEFIRGL